MSMQRIGRGVLRIASEFAGHLKGAKGGVYARLLPRIFNPAHRLDVAVRRSGSLIPSRNPFLRMMQMVARNQRAVVRPFANLAMQHRQLHYQQAPIARRRFLFQRPRHQVGVVERIRDLFGSNERYNADLRKNALPTQLDQYEIGENLGYGCNAAVYALRVKNLNQPSTSSSADLKAYPLALKLMYNYQFDNAHLSDDHLWREMGVELAPLPDSERLVRGRFGSYRPLSRTHPNIVRLHTAFVDTMPILPDAHDKYPDALPSAPFYESIATDPRTLFVVMKRYRMTLTEYVRTRRRNYWNGRVMLGQLLEGCSFLQESCIAQRDMKSDNVLLQFDHDGEAPHLVISDFGCALATGDWTVRFEDGVDLGGNICTRAPEIAMARHGSVVDFRLADTWAAGGLAYEIFTKENPFYRRLRSATYSMDELPVLPSKVPSVVCSVITALLQRLPEERVSPRTAATAVCLSLFRWGADSSATLAACGLTHAGLLAAAGDAGKTMSRVLHKLARKSERAVDDVLSLFSAETMVGRGLAAGVISDAEIQLRATVLSRITRDDVRAAAPYFLPNN